MRRASVVLLMCIVLAGCSYFGTVQSKWNALTPDEKARIIVSDLQGQLNNLFDTGKTYVTSKPEYQNIWKSTIVPAFDQANKSIATVIALGKTQTLTPDYVYSVVNPRLQEVLNYLVKIGAIKQ